MRRSNWFRWEYLDGEAVTTTNSGICNHKEYDMLTNKETLKRVCNLIQIIVGRRGTFAPCHAMLSQCGCTLPKTNVLPSTE